MLSVLNAALKKGAGPDERHGICWKMLILMVRNIYIKVWLFRWKLQDHIHMKSSHTHDKEIFREYLTLHAKTSLMPGMYQKGGPSG